LNADPNKPAAEEAARARESAPLVQPNLQSLLVATLVGAIILMIAMGAFWTSF
jgi:hypothetical protein